VASEQPIIDLRTHPERHVSVKQLADYFSVSEKTIYGHIDKGALQVIYIGRAVRIPIENARAYGNPRKPGEAVGRRMPI
jgi:excisionase family DNA binding protein